MSKYSLMSLAASICVVVLIVANSASATILETDSNSGAGTQTAFDSLILNNDLINTGQTSFLSASQSLPTVVNLGSIVDSHDGSTTPTLVTGGGSGLEFAEVGTTFTYQLNLNAGTGGSATGYTITDVHFINGWSTPTSFADQKWDLQIATFANPIFTTVYSVNYQPGTFNTTLVSLSGDIGSGVTGIQFVTSTPGRSVVREIDVLGAATVPEPASLSLLSVGGLLLMRRRRSH